MTTSISGTSGVTFNDASVQNTAATEFGFKNRIINGAMVVSQRGTTINSISSDGSYTADRWYINRGGTIDYTQSTSSPPTGFQYYASYINQSAGNPFLGVIQVIESINSFDLLGQTVTISVWLKAAANTAGSTAVTLSLGTATTANAKKTTDVGSTAFTISSSVWTKCTISVAVPSNALSISPSVSLGTMAVGDGVFVTGFQLEKGSTATSFDYRPYGTELILCQRYYENTYPSGTAVGSSVAQGYLYTQTVSAINGYINGDYIFKVTKRADPTVVFYKRDGTINVWFYGLAGQTETAYTPANITTNPYIVTWYNNITTVNANNHYGMLTASAEL